jgi:predicted molibdopterin-dependent oxidoreductase YjgC
MPQFVRVGGTQRPAVQLEIDGEQVTARQGDTLLTAILTHRRFLRQSEFGGEPRAGFCLMGACQDCWIWVANAKRVRACTTMATNGMNVSCAGPV